MVVVRVEPGRLKAGECVGHEREVLRHGSCPTTLNRLGEELPNTVFRQGTRPCRLGPRDGVNAQDPSAHN